LDKKTDILNAAQVLFSQFGLKKVTTDEIAKVARVSKATVYKYFQSKEEIFKKVVQTESDQLLLAIHEAVDKETSVEKKFRAYLLTKIGRIHGLVNFYKVTRETLSDYWPHIKEAQEQFMEEEKQIAGNILKLGADSGELNLENIDLTAHFLVISLKSLEYPWAMEGHNLTLSQYVDMLLHLLMNGLKKM